jgi:hypothetical protein
MLSTQDLRAVAEIDTYLFAHLQIDVAVRARLKEAQYRLVIATSLPRDAAKLARDLVYGTRDARLSAMAKLPRCRRRALPVLAEFLAEPDPLLREAAVDLILQTGKGLAHERIGQHLESEKDENVIHAALRRLEGADTATGKIVARYLAHASEDLVVAALGALAAGKNSQGARQVGAARAMIWPLSPRYASFQADHMRPMDGCSQSCPPWRPISACSSPMPLMARADTSVAASNLSRANSSPTNRRRCV